MTARYEDRMLRVLAHIYDNPEGDLSLDALSDVAAMSRFHWHRVFHAMTGETCAQAVRRMRLHRAAAWLVQTDRPIAGIANAIGYPSQQSFTRAFLAGYGITPGAFRRKGELCPPHLHVRKGDYPMHPIEIETHPARRLAAILHQGPYVEVGKAFESLGAVLTGRSLWAYVRGMIGVYYDDPDAVPAAELRSDAGAIVTGDAVLAEPLEERQLPPGRYVVMRYKGPYSGLAAAYRHLYGDWVPQSGEELGDHPPLEIYLNSPMDIAPEDLLTECLCPAKVAAVTHGAGR
ncbi:GyrI-like domain-containing protein [Aestuariibius sp. 2305UL40-4]|uniref:AraC family transcriptional regulator n=1 Tax=Aestuariibius violaceus TaxID=3234132 RepID=UPI00345EC21C